MRKILDIVGLEEHWKKKLTEVLQNVNNRDMVWLQEISVEAMNILSSNGEPQLMPKTPSQKNRRKKLCRSSVKNNQAAGKRLSKRDTSQLHSSKRISQDLQHKKDALPCRVTRSQVAKSASLSITSPCHRVTRSKALSTRLSNVSLKNAGIDLASGRIPLVEIGFNERRSADLVTGKEELQTKQINLPIQLLDDESPIMRSKCLAKASFHVVPDTPEAKIVKQQRGACKLKIANITIAETTENKEFGTQEELSAQQQESPSSKIEPPLNSNESPQTPTGRKANRQSVRRSLMGRTPVNSQATLIERYSLSNKRERMIKQSIRQSLSKRRTKQRSSICRHINGHTTTGNKENEEIIESQSKLDPVSPPQEANKSPRMSLRSQRNNMTVGIQSAEQQQEEETVEDSFKRTEAQMQPQSARRKASYKRALNEHDDGLHTEDELSPPRKKTLSPQCPASKVVRPFKTFLHTVQKNQRLMMTPGSGNRNGTVKSFLKQTTPLQTTLKEKERQRLESLRKKEEAEEHRKQKLEEEKRRRREEMKQKREERLRKVLQARERVEQKEEEKKRRLEQKHAQHEEKNEKMREEKMADDKVKKKVAAKKKEEHEAQRKQEEASRQKAMQLEEDRRRKELLHKKQEEEQLEKARKVAEQRQAELEKEKKLSAEREQEKKREQERRQAWEHEQQEKEKAVRLQKELLMAKEQLRKEMAEKEKRLQEQQKQEEKKATSEAVAKSANKQLNQTVEIENSSATNSYQMTPQAPKNPKIDTNDYGMDLNSDDSTDDESQPRKPIPAWASGNQLSQAIIQQYYKPPNTNALFGVVKSPRLEEIFYKNKPRYFKRTSSAVWNSPPFPGGKTAAYSLKR